MILVGGEALVDVFVDAQQEPAALSGTAVALSESRVVAGGSPFNLAVGLARLGVPSAFLGGLSEDEHGRMLLDRLCAERVALDYAVRSRRPTPLAIVSTGPDGQPAYAFHADGRAHEDLRMEDLPSSLPDDVSAIALGSFALAAEPVGSSLVALAEREAGRRVISLDPNLRPELVGDLDRWRRRFDALAGLAAIIKASEEDILSGYGIDPAELAARWLGAGALLVVVTRGERGASGFHASGAVQVPGRRARVMDTVGAGDTFHAALLARLHREERLERSAIAALDPGAHRALLEECCLAAAITCSRRGADLPSLAELRAGLANAAPAPAASIDTPSAPQQGA